MYELKSAYIGNALINAKLRHTCFKSDWLVNFVEITLRCACCPIARTCKYLIFDFFYGKSLHLKKNIFFVLANAAKFKTKSFKICLKMQLHAPGPL